VPQLSLKATQNRSKGKRKDKCGFQATPNNALVPSPNN
jgi:hypothetical protein